LGGGELIEASASWATKKCWKCIDWEADVRRPCLGAIRTGIQMKHEEVDSRIIQ